VGANDGCIEDHCFVLFLNLKASEYLCPVPTQRPVREPIENCLPRAESFGQIAPWDAGPRAVDDSVDEPSVVERRLRPASRGHENTDHSPLCIGHGVAVCHA
jgi:hypothetical protein